MRHFEKIAGKLLLICSTEGRTSLC